MHICVCSDLHIFANFCIRIFACKCIFVICILLYMVTYKTYILHVSFVHILHIFCIFDTAYSCIFWTLIWQWFLHLDAYYAYNAYFELTIVTESTLRAARQAIMEPLLESPFGCLLAKLLRRRHDCALVAERTLKSSLRVTVVPGWFCKYTTLLIAQVAWAPAWNAI